MRAGWPGFAKYVEGSWQNPWVLDAKVDGLPVAVLQGTKGKLVIPIEKTMMVRKDAFYELTLKVRNKARNQRILLLKRSMNAKTKKERWQIVGREKVPFGEGVVSFKLSGGHFHEGTNVVLLMLTKTTSKGRVSPVRAPTTGWYGYHYGSRARWSIALEWAAFGPAPYQPPGSWTTTSNPLLWVEHKGAKKRSVILPKNGTMDYHLLLNGRSFLSAELSGLEGKGSYRIRIQTDGKAADLLLKGRLEKEFKRIILNLSAYSGKAVRLSFECEDGGIALANPQIYSVALKKLHWAGTKPKYVFFWLSDTLRRDSVGAYGSKVKTPNFDRFAENAVVFNQATVQGPHSIPSHGTIVTGTYPPIHGFEKPENRLSSKLPLTYQLFKKAGWTTAVFSSNGYVSAKWGFTKGLDEFRNFIREQKSPRTEYLWSVARRYVKRKLKRPLFLYLVTIDPHVSYNPPNRFLKMYYPGRYRGKVPRRVTGLFLEKIITGAVKLRLPNDLLRLRALYNGEVTYNDFWFGKMMEDLKSMGILDKSVVLVTTDHGDEFLEHGSVGHGQRLYQEAIAAPLMMRWPGLPPGKHLVAPDVEIMDLHSTLLDLAGIPSNPEAQSRSLLPLVRGGRPVIMTSAFSYNWGANRSVKMGRYKLIVHRSGSYQLFDLKTDPNEQNDLTTTHPIALALLRHVFGIHNAFLERWKKTRWGQASNLKKEFNEDMGL